MAVFGGFAPSLAPLVISAVVRGNVGVVVPAQLFFGPAAFLGYRLLARSGPERTMGAWLADSRRPRVPELRLTGTLDDIAVGV